MGKSLVVITDNFCTSNKPWGNIPSRATATLVGTAKHVIDTLGDERQLEEVPSMTRKEMQRSRSRYGGWTIAGKNDRCDGGSVPELKDRSDGLVIEGL
jgi:hypothetical protein